MHGLIYMPCKSAEALQHSTTLDSCISEVPDVNEGLPHREGHGAVGFCALCPDIEGLATLHHNAWRQGVTLGVPDALVSVTLHVANLRQSPG